MSAKFLLSHAWQVSIGRLLVLVVAALLLGLLVGAPLLFVVIALAGHTVWSFYSLFRLQSWLRSRLLKAPPEEWGVWTDIAEFTYRKLRTERSRKRRLISLLRAFREGAAALPDGVVVLNRGRAILWCNESSSRLLGLRPRGDRGQLIDALMPNPTIRAWLSNGDEREPLVDVPAPHDASIRLILRMIPYAKNQQLLVARDISTLMRLEQIRRDFVANVSHELRTPLTVLHGYLDMLEPSDVPQWASVLDELRVQSQRMLHIVEDLLTLSRLEAQQTVGDDRVGMAGLIATLAREAEGLSQGKHRIIVESCAVWDLRGSAKDLQSAFSNLLSNAVRYTPVGGSIAMAWTASAKGASFVVRDSGYGIPAEHIPRITERFYRVSASRSRASGGTGLGLSIVKHVLGLHSARLEIESEVGKGSTFSCAFPLEQLLPLEPAEVHQTE